VIRFFLFFFESKNKQNKNGGFDETVSITDSGGIIDHIFEVKYRFECKTFVKKKSIKNERGNLKNINNNHRKSKKKFSILKNLQTCL